MVFGFPKSRNREKKLCITERREDRQEEPPDFSSGKDDHDIYINILLLKAGFTRCPWT